MRHDKMVLDVDVELGAFASRLQHFRQKSGLSLRKLEKASGISKALIHELEKGTRTNPTMRTVYSLALAMDVHPAELLGFHFGYPDITPREMELLKTYRKITDPNYRYPWEQYFNEADPQYAA